MPRHGKVSDMDRMWCGDEGKGIFFLVCIKYGIEDTQKEHKGQRKREKKKRLRDFWREKERKNSEKSFKPIDIQGKCYLPIDYETLRHISEKAVKKTT